MSQEVLSQSSNSPALVGLLNQLLLATETPKLSISVPATTTTSSSCSQSTDTNSQTEPSEQTTSKSIYFLHELICYF